MYVHRYKYLYVFHLSALTGDDKESFQYISQLSETT